MHKFLAAISIVLSIALTASAEEWAELDINVVTYNIHHGAGVDGVLDLDRIASLLLALRPDIVALNEVDKGIPRSRRVDQARYLAERLGMEYVFGSNLRYFGGEYGNAILSRFPIRDHRNTALKARGREPRGLLHAAVDAGGVLLHVMTTHLEVRDPAIRDAQIREIAEYAGRISGPVILMGDFNSPGGPRDPSGMLFPRLQDAWVLERLYFGDAVTTREGWPQEGGYTFSSKAPSRRIDYIFVSDEVRPIGPGSVRAVQSPASDHLPVAAALRLVQQAGLADGVPASPPAPESPAEKPGEGRAAAMPAPILFVSDHGNRETDAARFTGLFAPGHRAVPVTVEALAAKDVTEAAGTFGMVVLYNQTSLTQAALDWLASYRAAGGSLVALGITGLRLDEPVSFPVDGAAAGPLFAVQVAGWTYSELVDAVLYDCEQGGVVPVGVRGMLHLKAAPGGRAVLGHGIGCGAGDLLAAVATDRTLYVGVDPLTGGDAPAALVDVVKRSIATLLDPDSRRLREKEPAGDGGSLRM